MTGRLQLIEQKLLAIDSAGFQNLCDTYLLLKESQFSSFNRTGSQLGKKKTVKGTPDTFYRLPNGTLGYVEYTTQSENVVKKVIADIDKCLDEGKTGVHANETRTVTICFNSRLDIQAEAEIIRYAHSRKVGIDMIGIDTLALEICSKHLILAKEYLGIPLDTGQVLPLQKFIEEYNNKAGRVSTPIDNIFLHRVQELDQVGKTFQDKSLLIIAGFPGVGKTKLGVEAINRFSQENNSYQAYAIAKKDVDIHDDLRILLQSDKDYIILVDDANRQLPNLYQILGIYKESRKGNLKLILTVRNYAYEDVARLCHDYEFETIEVKKFTDEEIKDIIQSDSFEIRNSRYQKKIIEISDGNARLAVMAAKLAREKEQQFLWGDVSELYDSYFEKFIRDFDLDGNKTLLKTLGIISFFFSINRNDKEFVSKLLNLFELDYYTFNEAIDELHKRELVEVQYNIVRVSEQILSTYVFYKVFIKEQILSYRILLDNYFPNCMQRFRDSITPANNSFGYENVLGKVDGILNAYLESVHSDAAKVLEFFSLFWFYKPVETLAYFNEQIKQIPEPDKPVYTTKYDGQNSNFRRNGTLDFLSNFFHYHTSNLKPALELAFEYCRKMPNDLPHLIKQIEEIIVFEVEDEDIGFSRQFKLFELLREKFRKAEQPYISSFFSLSKTFLARHFHVTRGGRKHTITFYDYYLPLTPKTEEFRRTQWQFLFNNFENYPSETLDVLESFGPHFKDKGEGEDELLAFDLSLLVPFIRQKLSPIEFRHIHYVQRLVAWLNRVELTDRSYQSLKSIFYNEEYEDFLKLDWDRLRDKEAFDFENFEEYEALKSIELRRSFVFDSEKDFKRLHNTVHNILSNKENLYGLPQSLDVIIEENFSRNNKIGVALFRSIINNYPTNLGQLYGAIKVISNSSKVTSQELLNTMRGWEHSQKCSWLLTYFGSVPTSFVDKHLMKELLEVVDEIDSGCYIGFEIFEKFEAMDPEIMTKVLEKIVSKIDKQGIAIRLSHNFFEKFTQKLSANSELLSKAYLQQESFDNHFEPLRKGLQQMISVKPEFLITYVDKVYNQVDEVRRDRHNRLGFIWDMEIPNSLIETAIDKVIEGSRYLGILEHPANIFFNNLSEGAQDRVKTFLLSYITKNCQNEERINSIFDVIRHTMKTFHEQAFLHFLASNNDVTFFKEIWWRGNGGGVHRGDVNFGELEARDWGQILAMVDKYPNQLDVLAIKAHLKKEISRAMDHAEYERQRSFANPD